MLTLIARICNLACLLLPLAAAALALDAPPMRGRARLQVLLSPAKTLDMSACAAADAAAARASAPEGAARARALAATLARLDAAALGATLKVSPKLAELNARRYASFDAAEGRQAIVAYAGQAYAGLRAREGLSPAQLAWAHRRVLIPSALYGPVRPLDRIRPYRLEPKARGVAPPPHRGLAAYWRATTTRALLRGFGGDGDGDGDGGGGDRDGGGDGGGGGGGDGGGGGGARYVVNLASKEYAALVDWKAVEADGVRVVT